MTSLKRCVALVALAIGVLLGPGAMAASAQPSSATYGPTPTIRLSITIIDAGKAIQITIYGSGFIGSEKITNTVHSTPQVVGTETSNADGTFATTDTFPADLEVGTHTVVATGSSGDSASATLQVTNGSTSSGTSGTGATGASAGSGGSSGGLAFTGTDEALTAAVGAAAIGTGGLLVLASRKRRRRVWH